MRSVFVDQLFLHDIRSYRSLEVGFGPGLTFLTGQNGSGKSSVLEAISYLASGRSFRGAPLEALVRLGCDRGVVRGATRVEGRQVLVESELIPGGRSRTLVNKQPLRAGSGRRDLLSVTVFSPDDLVIIKGGPGERRDVIDGLLRSLHPRNEGLLTDLDRILRQRNALLKQAGGRLTPEVAMTLDVWDAKLAGTGESVAAARDQLVEDLRPFMQQAYNDIADVHQRTPVGLRYRCTFISGGFAAALDAGRLDDVKRAVTRVGPHRDDLEVSVDTRQSRTHASQGEQRTLALALRLAGHRLLAERLEATPVLLLDDVFSELDRSRSAALLQHLPPGQVLLASATEAPLGAVVETMMDVTMFERASTVVVRSVSTGDKPVESVDEIALSRVEEHEIPYEVSSGIA